MSWLLIAIIAYFFLAISSILDRLLLKKHITQPSVYAFYVALLSLISIVLIPFGFEWVGLGWAIISIISGASFIYALLFLYYAVRENEISKIAPLVGTIVQITTFLIAVLLFEKEFTLLKSLGLILLIAGGFLISFDLPLKPKNILKGFKFSVLSGILFAVAYSLYEYIYGNFKEIVPEDFFVNGFVWTRLGLVLGGVSLLINKKYRKNIKNSFFGKKKEDKQHRSFKTILLFMLNKVSGGSASIILNYAISIGGAALVHAVSSVQFVFVLILAAIASIKYPKIFEEKLFFWDWAQKIGAIALIGAGIMLIAF